MSEELIYIRKVCINYFKDEDVYPTMKEYFDITENADLIKGESKQDGLFVIKEYDEDYNIIKKHIARSFVFYKKERKLKFMCMEGVMIKTIFTDGFSETKHCIWIEGIDLNAQITHKGEPITDIDELYRL